MRTVKNDWSCGLTQTNKSTQSRRRRLSSAATLAVAEPLEARRLLSMTFAAAVSYPVNSQGPSSEPDFVTIGNFTGDGKDDLAVVYAGTGCLTGPPTGNRDGGVSVLLGNGNGVFQTAGNYTINYAVGDTPESVAVGDFTGNGIEDLAVASQGTGPSNVGGVSVLLGNGDGTFKAPVNYVAGIYPCSIAVGDFTDDGKADLAVADEGGGISVLLGNGDGTFQTARNYAAGNEPESVAVGNFTGNGIEDLAVVDRGTPANSFSDGDVSVLLGNGDGTFQPPVTYATGTYPWSVTVGNFTGDGKEDLAVAHYAGGSGEVGDVSVLLGNGDGSFQTAVNYASDYDSQSVAVGDFNGDGKADLAATTDSGVLVLLGNGNGTFQSAVNISAGGGASITAGDLNGDGKADLALVTGYDTVNVLLNTSTPPASPVLSNLTASSSIPQGATTATFGGSIAAGASIPPDIESVAITLNGVTQNAAINSNGSFSATFNTSQLPASTTPYQVTYNYAGDTNFGAVTDNTTTTLLVMPTNGTETPVYRLYSQVTKEHLYTADLNEYNTLGSEGWDQEGLAYNDYNGLVTIGGVTTIPLYRLYNIPDQQHLWTTDPNEYNTLKDFVGTWSVDGISGYIFPANGNASTSLAAVPGSAALYRMSWPFNPAADIHLWTTDLNEYDTDAATYGWTKEGLIGYVM